MGLGIRWLVCSRLLFIYLRIEQEKTTISIQHDVRKVINESLTSVDEEKRIEILMKLRGVSWAVASVILHFAFPNKYPILDFRALWSLDKVRPKSYGFRFWIEYVLEFRNLVQETGLYGRTIDRGLWM